jgi:hypothetical protein
VVSFPQVFPQKPRTRFAVPYIVNNHSHRATTHLQLINMIMMIMIIRATCPSPSHSVRFYHPHNSGWGVQIINLFNMKFYPLPSLQNILERTYLCCSKLHRRS